MKKIFLGLAVVTMLATACNNDKKNEAGGDTTVAVMDDGMTTASKPAVTEGTYVNLSSGEKVDIVRDTVTGIAVDKKTQLPVEFYYDPVTLDTIYQNGLVVNHLLINEGNGKYKLDDMKIKIDGNEIKIKTDSSKMKIDGDKMKVKNGDDKMKIDGENGKMKTDDSKMKVEDGEVKAKPRN